LVAAVVERPPDVLEPGVHRASHLRVIDFGPVELDPLTAVNKWSGDHHPFGRITVLEVRIRSPQEELVETDCWVADVEPGLAAVAVDDLRPRHSRAIGLKCSVILCSALEMLRVLRIDRQRR